MNNMVEALDEIAIAAWVSGYHASRKTSEVYRGKMRRNTEYCHSIVSIRDATEHFAHRLCKAEYTTKGSKMKHVLIGRLQIENSLDSSLQVTTSALVSFGRY